MWPVLALVGAGALIWRFALFPGSILSSHSLSSAFSRLSDSPKGYPVNVGCCAQVWVYETSSSVPCSTLIFYCHGNGGSIEQGWGAHMDELMRQRRLGEGNCRVATFDYRGYGRSSGWPTAGNIVEDASHVLECLTQTHEPARIELHGRSLGGWVVARMLTQNLLPPDVASRISRVHLITPLLGTRTVRGFQTMPEMLPRLPPLLPGSTQFQWVVKLAGNDELIDNAQVRRRLPLTAQVQEFPGAGHNAMHIF